VAHAHVGKEESRKALSFWRGTEGSNPSPSSRESANFRFLRRKALPCLSAAQHYRADAHHGSFPLSGSDIGLQIPLGFMQVLSFRAAADNLGKQPSARHETMKLRLLLTADADPK
jgi:hypothetical protein